MTSEEFKARMAQYASIREQLKELQNQLKEVEPILIQAGLNLQVPTNQHVLISGYEFEIRAKNEFNYAANDDTGEWAKYQALKARLAEESKVLTAKVTGIEKEIRSNHPRMHPTTTMTLYYFGPVEE